MYSTGLLTEMVQKGVGKIHIGDKLDSIIPQRNVSICAIDTGTTLLHCMIMDSTYRPPFHIYFVE